MTTQLYLISPPAFELDAFSKQLEAALQINRSPLGGSENFIGAFQLRLKNASDEQIITATKTLLPICQQHDVAFIINDRVDLCMKYDCDGVHVGQEDLLNASVKASCLSHEAQLKAGSSTDSHSTTNAIKHFRSQLGEDRVLGITCHASKHLAMEAAEAGADYVAFGAFYPTTSKSMEKLEKWGTPTPDILEWWTTWTEIPCVAIGGITPQNCAPLLAADFLAVITAIWNHPDGAGAAVKAFYNYCTTT